VPEYVYDPQRQIATDPAGDPLGPFLKKDWTSIPGTHTDGDGGDNETYDWEKLAEQELRDQPSVGGNDETSSLF
jgi:putative ATP-grasp target RiPP